MDSQPFISSNESLLTRRRPSNPKSPEEVLVRLLLVSGNRTDFTVPLSHSIQQIKQLVISEWPTEWSMEEEKAESIDRLRILYQGRFLEDSNTLKSLNLPKEQYVTMHLLLKPKSVDSMVKTRKSSKGKNASSATNNNPGCCACLQM